MFDVHMYIRWIVTCIGDILATSSTCVMGGVFDRHFKYLGKYEMNLVCSVHYLQCFSAINKQKRFVAVAVSNLAFRSD